ncbi:hypothetical protein [Streptomyces sp. NPDC019208]|uniref:hypothetical protein n=1 Tax=Streptomyces sp. NPDC019208 TaxID=3154683 RepID=UPI0033CC2BB5
MSFTVPSPDKGAAQSIPAGFRPSGAPLPGIPAQPAAATRETLPAATPAVDVIFDTPIETLLEQYRVTVIESQIRDREFYGAVVVRGDRITLLQSPDRSEFEREFFIRYLVCQALGVDMTPLPEPFEVHPLAGGVAA